MSAAGTPPPGCPDMNASAKRLFRCAIYTRKSTEHNLDLEFNSLDAQREACEAYIKSQAHEGWRLVRTRYDDGGLSGASLDRPALQELLDDVRARKVDVIVVYKVDRLPRSLADFAQLVELFDKHSVSFVSITQSCDTTTRVGRRALGCDIAAGECERVRARGRYGAVQPCGGECAVERGGRVGAAPAILMGRIFDDRGNRMTPSHSNKAGVRYRYYVSHALLQRRKDEAGGVARVPAAQVEATVVEAVRQSLRKNAPTEGHSDVSDREAIDRFVERIVISPKSIEIHLREPRAVEATETNRSSAAPHARDSDEDTAIAPAPVITVPWNAPAFVSVKGVLHQPSGKAMLKPETRDAILLAIVKARTWIDDLVSGRVQSFAEIAQHEGKLERNVRLLAPLAFTPPGMLAAIIAG